jgi:heptosyltransferase-2
VAARKILVFHTAFIGDIVLALPLVQQLHDSLPQAHIAFVAIPSASNVLENHPAINEVIVYDKRGRDAGVAGIFKIAKRLRSERFDVALIPHRSLRSAVVGWLARIPRRVGFSTSAAQWLFTDVMAYDKNSHEIDRNLSLLKPLGITDSVSELPTLYPSEKDKNEVNEILLHRSHAPSLHQKTLIGLAPGSVWNTKRWPEEYFIELSKMLLNDGFLVVLIGGKEDAELCEEIGNAIGPGNVINAAGKLSLLQSAELIRRCALLVSNDSAPMHLAVGMRTPVVAIFGATTPQFGFAPRGKQDVVAEINGLSCRPCAIHGGERCPIKTFVCMNDLTPQLVYSKVRAVIDALRSEVR